ncbi:MAG: hypothetical protein AAGU25_03510 [bacterium]
MPKQDYAFELNGPRRLEISWGMFWKNIIIRLDGQELDTFANQNEFRQGKEYKLDDGSVLSVRLVNSLMGQDVQVARNGKPLPGTMQDPQTRLRSSYVLLYFIGGWKILFGILGLAVNGVDFSVLSRNFIDMFVGLVFILMAYLVHKRLSLIALIAGIALFAGDSLYSAYTLYQAGQQQNVFSLLIQVFLVYYLYQGVRAIKKVKAERESSAFDPL